MKFIFSILFILSTVFVNAQSKIKYKDKPLFDKTDFAFYQGNDDIVIDIFKDFITKYPENPTVIFEYGSSMLNLGLDLEKAEELLQKAIQLGKQEAYFNYGRVLFKNEKLEDALKVFQSYRMLTKKDHSEDEIYDQLALIHQAIKLMKTPIDVVITNLGSGVNTSAKEYTPITTGDSKNLYYTSRKVGSTGNKQDLNGAYFEDIYFTHKIDEEWIQGVQLDSTINTSSHDATVALSADGNTMVIYRTNKNLTGGDLYITTKKDSIWQSPTLMNGNINTKYQEASACLSYNGRVMYFTSNRPGGYGGKDLYIVRLLPNNEWSLAQNIGPIVNTSKDEDSPVLNKTSTVLYFSSNGHRTMGGFDIFKSEKVYEQWSIPENMGYPINTVNDELYLALDDSELTGYYSSNMNGGYGLQDIYQIDFIFRDSKDLVIKGLVMNEENNPIQAKITVYNQDKKEEFGIYLSNQNTGKYIMALHPLVNYKITIEAEGFKKIEEFVYYDKLSFSLLEYEIEMHQLIAE